MTFKSCTVTDPKPLPVSRTELFETLINFFLVLVHFILLILCLYFDSLKTYNLVAKYIPDACISDA